MFVDPRAMVMMMMGGGSHHPPRIARPRLSSMTTTTTNAVSRSVDPVSCATDDNYYIRGPMESIVGELVRIGQRRDECSAKRRWN
jgi:hypothetical protein